MPRKELHVVDISPCIYAGKFNKNSFIEGDIVNTAGGYRVRNIPTGGTSMLFNILAQYMSDDADFVFVADRNPTIKKEMWPAYKSTRTHPQDVMLQKEIAEYILQDCGFTVYAEDGYEADDIIYSVVKRNRYNYEHIYVHTADSDLYLLVSDTVSIRPTSSRAKSVDMVNYTYTCKTDQPTPYNTVVFRKFLKGDSSKCIQALPKKAQDRITQLFYQPRHLPYLGDTGYVKALMQKYFPEYTERVLLFYPLCFLTVPKVQHQGDRYRIQVWAGVIKNRKIPSRPGDLSVQIRELMDRNLYED